MIELKTYTIHAVGDVPPLMYWLLFAVSCFGMGWFLWRKGMREGLRSSSVLLFVEWVLLVVAMTVVFRQSRGMYRINLMPLWSYFDYGDKTYLKEMAAINLLNVVLFIPVGFLASCGFRGMTWRTVLCIGAALSVIIELLQLVFKKGLCETDDVIHNVLGCVIGYGLSRLIVLQNHQSEETARQ